jgi:hypothetical protein
MHLGCRSTFGKRKNTLACGSSIFTLSESLATSLVHGHAILHGKSFGIPLFLKVLVMKIFEEIIERYLKMGCGQFLRDFRRDFHLKKTLAHRKAVLARKEKAKEQQMKIELKAIENDRSPAKRSSHVCLLALINQIHDKGMIRLYKKTELQQLCSAYGVRFVAKWNKSKLVKELVSKVIECIEMPCHEVMSRYAVNEVVRSDNAPDRLPVLRFRRL